LATSNFSTIYCGWPGFVDVWGRRGAVLDFSGNIGVERKGEF
jgi:hypothetical protein